MKKVLALLLMSLLVVALALPAFAMGEEMTVKKAVITVDGKIDEAWAKADRQELGYVKNNVAKPDDSAAFASALWNGNTIYFLFEIIDDDPSFASTEGDWRNDGIYLYLEELGTGGKTFTEGQYQFAIIPKEGFSQVPRRGDAAAMGAFEYAYTETSTGYVIEAAYTFNKITLAADMDIYADFQYNDSNGAKERTHNFGWSDQTDAAVNDATVWGTLILSAEEIKVAATTTAAPVTTAAVTTAAPTTAAATQAPSAPSTPSAPSAATADVAVILAAVSALAASGVVVLKKKH